MIFSHVTIYILFIGEVDEKDSKGRATMLFRERAERIPNETTLIIFELLFRRSLSSSGALFGIADQLSMIIKQK